MAAPSANSGPASPPNPPATSGAPPPSWAGAPTPAGAWSAPSPPRKGRGPLLLVAVVVVVIVGVVVALALAGVFTGHGGSNNASTSAQTFSQGLASAQSAANGQGSGYQPIYADGFSSSVAVTLPLSVLQGALAGGICTFTAISTVASFAIPASGNLSLGSSADWVFIFHGSAGLLVVTVASGSATALGTLTGSTCLTTFATVQAIPSGVEDSSTASLALDQRGGFAFLRAHATAISTLFISGPISVAGHTLSSSWEVGYSACDAAAAGTSGAEIDASIDAESGTVTSVSNTTVSCGFSTGSPGGSGGGNALSADLSLAPPAEASAGTNFWYNFTINAASGGLTYGDLVFFVESSAGQVVPISGTMSAIHLTGTTLASYSLTSASWTSGGTTSVSNQDVLSLQTATNIGSAGDLLYVIGTGSITGEISVAIP